MKGYSEEIVGARIFQLRALVLKGFGSKSSEGELSFPIVRCRGACSPTQTVRDFLH